MFCLKTQKKIGERNHNRTSKKMLCYRTKMSQRSKTANKFEKIFSRILVGQIKYAFEKIIHDKDKKIPSVEELRKIPGKAKIFQDLFNEGDGEIQIRVNLL